MVPTGNWTFWKISKIGTFSLFQIYTRGCLDVVNEIFIERLVPSLFVYGIFGITMLILQVLNIVCNCVTIRAIHREEKEEIRRRKKEFDEKNRLRAALSQSQLDNLSGGNEYQNQSELL